MILSMHPVESNLMTTVSLKTFIFMDADLPPVSRLQLMLLLTQQFCEKTSDYSCFLIVLCQ